MLPKCGLSTAVTWIILTFIDYAAHGRNLSKVEQFEQLFKGYDHGLPPNYNTDNTTLVLVQIYILSIDSINEASMTMQRQETFKKAEKKDSNSNLIPPKKIIPVTQPKDIAMLKCPMVPKIGYVNTLIEVNKHLGLVRILFRNFTVKDYKLTMFLRQKWNDPRLAFRETYKDRDVLELDTNIMEKLWVPDMYILTEKRADFHEVTVPNKLMHIYPNGDIQYSARVTGTFSCPMHLMSYPFDRQSCSMEFESYGYSTKTMVFRWHEEDVTKSDTLQLPQYKMKHTESYVCDRPYYGIMFTCIGVHFTFERMYGYYVIQIYIPSILLVILSWMNFWLDCEAVPARITLGILTVLAMTTQFSGTRADLPRVSYVKAIDIWMAACLTFVFAGLVEFAIVNVLARKERRKRQPNDQYLSRQSTFRTSTKSEINGYVNGHCHVEQPETVEATSRIWKWFCFWTMAGIERARAFDKVSRVLFPLMFIMFNVVYWIYYHIL